jgi:hypothetical protein
LSIIPPRMTLNGQFIVRRRAQTIGPRRQCRGRMNRICCPQATKAGIALGGRSNKREASQQPSDLHWHLPLERSLNLRRFARSKIKRTTRLHKGSSGMACAPPAGTVTVPFQSIEGNSPATAAAKIDPKDFRVAPLLPSYRRTSGRKDIQAQAPPRKDNATITRRDGGTYIEFGKTFAVTGPQPRRHCAWSGRTDPTVAQDDATGRNIGHPLQPRRTAARSCSIRNV